MDKQEEHRTAGAIVEIAETLRAILDELREQRKPMGRCVDCAFSQTTWCSKAQVSLEPVVKPEDFATFGCVYFEQRS